MPVEAAVTNRSDAALTTLTDGATYTIPVETGWVFTGRVVVPEGGKSYRLRIHYGYFDEITQNWHDMNGWLEKAGGKDYVTAQGGTVFTVQDSMIDAKIEKLVSADSNWDDVFSAVRSGTEIEKIFYNLQDSAAAVAVAYDEQGRLLESRSTLLTSADGNAVARFRFTNAAAATKLSFYLVREGSWIPTDERQTMQY